MFWNRLLDLFKPADVIDQNDVGKLEAADVGVGVVAGVEAKLGAHTINLKNKLLIDSAAFRAAPPAQAAGVSWAATVKITIFGVLETKLLPGEKSRFKQMERRQP